MGIILFFLKEEIEFRIGPCAYPAMKIANKTVVEMKLICILLSVGESTSEWLTMSSRILITDSGGRTELNRVTGRNQREAFSQKDRLFSKSSAGLVGILALIAYHIDKPLCVQALGDVKQSNRLDA